MTCSERSALAKPSDLEDLAQLSAKVGGDPLLIQAAGGNTSVKDGDVMWIKASGTVLADAERRDIFVPVDLPAMRKAVASNADNADRPAEFALGDQSLRPSIETSLHAVFRQRIVVHVHCVNTLAHAVRRDAPDLLAEKLSDFDWAFVPYVKPGANLAGRVAAALGPATDVIVLGNHGLIVAAETVAEAEALLDRVVAASTLPVAPYHTPDIAALMGIATAGWSVPDAAASLHQLALDPGRVAQATAGSLYPDHVIFCGVGSRALTAEKAPLAEESPVFLIVPGKGVILRADASTGARALARCLGDVLIRVPPNAELTYLTEAQNGELLNWDAEKYRQALND